MNKIDFYIDNNIEDFYNHLLDEKLINDLLMKFVVVNFDNNEILLKPNSNDINFYFERN